MPPATTLDTAASVPPPAPQVESTLSPRVRDACRPWAAAAISWLGRYTLAVANLAIVVAVLALLRIALVISYVDPQHWTLSQTLHLAAVGFRYDLLAGLCFGLPQVLHITLVGDRRISRPFSGACLEAAWLIGTRRMTLWSALLVLGPGVFILLGVRAALVGADWWWVSLALLASFPLHLLDLRRRLRSKA